MLDYDCIKNHYRLTAVDLSRHKELDSDSKVMQPNNPDDSTVVNESMFALTILEKIKETRLKFSQGSLTIS